MSYNNRLEYRAVALGLTFSGLLICSTGCEKRPATYPVKGQFRFEDGTVPKFGDVEFYHPALRLNARGKIQRDGSFTVSTFKEGDGAVVGKHQIIVMQHVSTPLMARAISDMEVQHDHGKLMSNDYLDYRTSDLECEVVSGENRFEWTLKLNPQQTADGLPKKR